MFSNVSQGVDRKYIKDMSNIKVAQVRVKTWAESSWVTSF